MGITKAPTLRGLARSFLISASAATFSFTRIHCRVSGSSSYELSVVGSRKLSPSPSASLPCKNGKAGEQQMYAREQKDTSERHDELEPKMPDNCKTDTVPQIHEAQVGQERSRRER
ncbi:hypothetical protein Tco_0974388 [Tanacetum coccineum]|uniref:Uncharacterized protein n=1 Tax=Tanacetum coccineum TaxID=301880 RepID=A0ABQ5EBJ8_9ASTR